MHKFFAYFAKVFRQMREEANTYIQDYRNGFYKEKRHPHTYQGVRFRITDNYISYIDEVYHKRFAEKLTKEQLAELIKIIEISRSANDHIKPLTSILDDVDSDYFEVVVSENPEKDEQEQNTEEDNQTETQNTSTLLDQRDDDKIFLSTVLPEDYKAVAYDIFQRLKRKHRNSTSLYFLYCWKLLPLIVQSFWISRWSQLQKQVKAQKIE